MQFEVIDAGRIVREWPAIAEILAPAVLVHSGATMQTVFDRLVSGYFKMIQYQAAEARLIMVFRLFDDDDGKVACFASYLAGNVPGGPRRMVRTMRRLMTSFEATAREAGVQSIYIGGRDWGAVFPDFVPVDDVPNRRRKVLS